LEYPEHLPVSQYAVNIGLALKGTAPPKDAGDDSHWLPDMNLLPEVYKPWRPSARQIYAFLAIVAAIVLLFPLYQVTTEAMDKTAALEARYNIVNGELERRKTALRTYEPLQGAIAQYSTIVNMGGGFIEDLKVITDEAEEFGVEVGAINHDGRSISMSCQADSHITFRAYLAALEESGRFSIASRPPERYSYPKGGSITLKTK